MVLGNGYRGIGEMKKHQDQRTDPLDDPLDGPYSDYSQPGAPRLQYGYVKEEKAGDEPEVESGEGVNV